MNAIIYLFLALSVVGSLGAQTSFRGMVVDAQSLDPISFANIGVIESGTGTVSDEAGRFTITVPSDDTEITLSSIGFETTTVYASELAIEGTIRMRPVAYTMKMVEIAATRLSDKDVQLGVKNKDRGMAVGFGNTQLGTEIGSVIHVKKPTYIKNANFVLNHAKGDSMLFRVNIYDYSTGTAGQKLLPNDILIREKQRKGVITVNLEAYSLVLDGDVLLTLEWIKDLDEAGNKGITFDTKRKGKRRGIYMRWSSNGPLEKIDSPYIRKNTLCFYLIGRQEK